MRDISETTTASRFERYAQRGASAFAPDDPDWGEGTPTASEMRRLYSRRIATFRRILGKNNGMVPAWRAVGVTDVGDWLRRLEQTGKTGAHWAWRRSAATTDYAGEVTGSSTVVMTALIPDGSIDWEATMDANGNRPWECEVLPHGPFRVTGVLDEAGRLIYRPKRKRFTPSRE